MIKFREHKAAYDDSMATMVECADYKALLEHLQSIEWVRVNIENGAHKDSIKISKYGYQKDTRNGWDTHLVTVNGFVIGFTDCDPYTDGHNRLVLINTTEMINSINDYSHALTFAGIRNAPSQVITIGDHSRTLGQVLNHDWVNYPILYINAMASCPEYSTKAFIFGLMNYLKNSKIKFKTIAIVHNDVMSLPSVDDIVTDVIAHTGYHFIDLLKQQ